MDYNNWGTALLGLALVYWIVATLAMYLRELLALWFNTRAKGMQLYIRRMLGREGEGDSLAEQVLQHPLLQSQHTAVISLKKPAEAPSYIPSGLFAKALIDVIATAAKNKESGKTELGAGTTRWDFSAIEAILTDPKQKEAAAATTGSEGTAGTDTAHEGSDNQPLPIIPDTVRQALAPLLARANRDVDAFEAQVAAWFDATMDRTSGWYKRRTTIVLLGISLLLVSFFNIDTLMLAKHLSANPELRRALAREAEIVLSAGDSDKAAEKLKAMVIPAMARSSLGSSQLEALSASQISGEGMVKDFGRTWAAAVGLKAMLCPESKMAERPETCNETKLIEKLDVLVTVGNNSRWCPAAKPIDARTDATQLANCECFVDALKHLQEPLAAFLDKGREEEARAKDIFAALPHVGFLGIKGEFWIASAKEEAQPHEDCSKEPVSWQCKILHPPMQWLSLKLGVLHLPVQWLFLKLGGLLITVILTGFGAPFWYDLMGRLASSRATGPKPEPGAMT